MEKDDDTTVVAVFVDGELFQGVKEGFRTVRTVEHVTFGRFGGFVAEKNGVLNAVLIGDRLVIHVDEEGWFSGHVRDILLRG